MSTDSSTAGLTRTSSAPAATQLLTACEVLIVYAGILYYIWRWQFTHPGLWIPLLVIILVSHVAHRDDLRTLGLAGTEFGGSARTVLPMAAAVYLAVTIYALAHHVLAFVVPGKPALVYFAAYGTWCVFQQYLVQSYFNNRLLGILQNRHLSSAVVGALFGSAHIPNPVLMLVTTAGGFFLAQAFARHRNIWPLALAHTVAGFLVAAVTPASLVHNMRVGPGYFFYGIR